MEFRLIVDTPSSSASTHSLELNGSTWYLSEALTVPIEAGESQTPPFTCISYVWGHDRSPNPFHPEQLMSSATLPSLSVAMQHSAHRAFWIDALCVPTAHAPRHATLGSMGFIYSLAAEVLITSPTRLYPVLAAMQSAAPLPDEMLLHLEQDPWITSVWTYQEVVNSGRLAFVAGDAKVDGSDFLNQLGTALTQYRAARHLTPFDLAALPNLHALEDLLADWMTGGYGDRSALRTMTQLRYRHSAHPQNYFYAAVGSIVQGPWVWNLDLGLPALSTEFMALCDAKNDHSYIYTTARRATHDPHGRIWRPAPGLLVPLLLWHSWGAGQRGRWAPHGFSLENMLSLVPCAAMPPASRAAWRAWLQRYPDSLADDDAATAAKVLAWLRKMAYGGSARAVGTAHGLFFLQVDPEGDATVVEVCVALGVRWAFGAPGLARVTRGEEPGEAGGERVEYIPGVFVGDVYELRHLAVDVLLVPRVPVG